jgi:hypothetical protein
MKIYPLGTTPFNVHGSGVAAATVHLTELDIPKGPKMATDVFHDPDE